MANRPMKSYTVKNMSTMLTKNGFTRTEGKGSHAKYIHPDGRHVSFPSNKKELNRMMAQRLLKENGIRAEV